MFSVGIAFLRSWSQYSFKKIVPSERAFYLRGYRGWINFRLKKNRFNVKFHIILNDICFGILKHLYDFLPQIFNITCSFQDNNLFIYLSIISQVLIINDKPISITAVFKILSYFICMGYFLKIGLIYTWSRNFHFRLF